MLLVVIKKERQPPLPILYLLFSILLQLLIQRSQLLPCHNLLPVLTQRIFPKRLHAHADIDHFFEVLFGEPFTDTNGDVYLVFIDHVFEFLYTGGIIFLEVIHHDAIADTVFGTE